MRMDPTNMPGTLEVPAGQVRMTTPTSDTFTNYGTPQSLTFDEDSDRVELSPANGARIILDITVTC